MLTEIIRIKLDKLYSELDKLSRENDVSDLDTLEEISIKCEDFLSILAESRSNITTLNTDDMTDILIKYGNNPYDKKEVSDKFKYIKLVYLGIDRGLDISISDTQEAFLESYITNVMQVVKNIRSTINEKNDKKNELQSKIDELRDFIIELEALLDKINDQNNEEVLDANDFNTFYKIVEDDEISNDIKMQGLIEFRRYNINGVIGRRDIARLLHKKGYFKNEDDAIKKLFSPNKKYYIKTKKNKIEDCISVIKKSNGITVLAHPWTLNLSMEDLKKFLIKYKFDGIEVYNHKIEAQLYEQLNLLASDLNLYKTCGTDYHGHKGLNDFNVDREVDSTKILQRLYGDKYE